MTFVLLLSVKVLYVSVLQQKLKREILAWFLRSTSPELLFSNLVIS